MRISITTIETESQKRHMVCNLTCLNVLVSFGMTTIQLCTILLTWMNSHTMLSKCIMVIFKLHADRQNQDIFTDRSQLLSPYASYKSFVLIERQINNSIWGPRNRNKETTKQNKITLCGGIEPQIYTKTLAFCFASCVMLWFLTFLWRWTKLIFQMSCNETCAKHHFLRPNDHNIQFAWE